MECRGGQGWSLRVIWSERKREGVDFRSFDERMSVARGAYGVGNAFGSDEVVV